MLANTETNKQTNKTLLKTIPSLCYQ